MLALYYLLARLLSTHHLVSMSSEVPRVIASCLSKSTTRKDESNKRTSLF